MSSTSRAARAGIGHAEVEDGAEPETRARERGRASVVRLEPAARDHDLGPASERVGEEELELADLVARLGPSGRVVAFDPDLRSDDLVERGPALDRRRPVYEEEAPAGRFHRASPA